ncbi:MAG: hypothetical protein JL50_17535 [Peptococcaceae bacterium BICA1-7]|nr:MAG: hypothetical protein JL50_17535 [Peptococcaceae bacterium BICA1-7]HBV98649.1 DUF3795 domain-containing protein [Desulfotomaculum sp.]
MKTAADIAMVGPCGIYCGDCECHKAKDNPNLLEYLVTKGIKREKLPCPGCRSLKGNCPALGSTCETYTCASDRGIDFCFQCPEFPCARLNPAADRASVLPHNIKVFNLCCIQQQGLDKWLEKAPEIKQKYFRGKMIIGKGPQLE